MRKWLTIAAIGLVLNACARTPGEVADKVLVDFGIRAKPEGYKSESDSVFDQLPKVGAVELKRLNQEGRKGEVKFQDEGGLSGKFYKEVRVYENFYPLEARPASRQDSEEAAYIGYIEYAYRVHQSARKNSRAEASVAAADIPTTEYGRETYRYKFRRGGIWNGEEGQKARK